MDVKALRDEIQEIHDSGDCGKALSDILDMANRMCDQPSDLEIVQKALEKSKSMIRIYPDGTGTLVSQDENGLAVFGEFTDVDKVLTWAKQTIGVE